MSLIAKTYVKALIKAMNQKELDESLNSLYEISLAFKDKKFLDILFSKSITLKQREDFLLSLIKKPNKKLTNFIKILNTHDRLEEIPHIVLELKNQISQLKKEYEGEIISNFKLNDKDKKEIEDTLSKKFDAKIKLKNKVSDYSGIKVEIDALGIEVGFSAKRLKSQISEYILKSL